VPWKDATDATLYSLRRAASRSLGIRPGARLACVTVIAPGDSNPADDSCSEVQVHRWQLDRLRQWARGLDLQGHRLSYHVLESSDTGEALLNYARANRTTLMIVGAATHGLKMQRVVATVPVRVAMDAPCSVMLVKQSLPFERLAESDPSPGAAAATMDHVVSPL
jgi:eukaryotic-like serine/threonine-protein kinase